MATVQLDTRGRLLRFAAGPSRQRAAGVEYPDPDWKALFTAAGLDSSAFRETRSVEAPTEHGDVRRAWEGVYPDSPDVPIRIEAAAARGRAFYFRIIEPWMGMPGLFPGAPGRTYVFVALSLTAFALGVWQAMRNVRLGRGDPIGSARVGFVVFAVSLCGGLLGSDYSPDLEALRDVVMRLITWAIAAGTTAALFYLAIEPPVRRRWPRVLIGWTRFTRGQFKDPRVGRDVLIGVLAACAFLLLTRTRVLLAAIAGVPPDLGAVPADPGFLDGGRFVAAGVLEGIVLSALGTFASLLSVFALTLVVRRPWIAVMAVIVLMGSLMAAQTSTPLFSAPFIALGGVIYYSVLLRVGLLAHITAGTVINIGMPAAFTLQASAWYAPYGWAILAGIVALGIYGARTSLGGRPLFQTQVLGD
jgi:serine/threonine-protein kinase